MAIKDYFLKYKPSEDDKNTLFGKTNTAEGVFLNYFVVVLILISLGILIFASIPGFGTKYVLPIYISNFIINTIFLFEYLYRFKSSTHKLQFPFRILNIFHLLSFLPFFILSALFGVGNYSIFAVFRVFRIFRIFELLGRNPVLTKIVYGIKEHKVEYISTIIMTGILLIFLSTIVYFVEFNWGDKEAFYSIPHTLWWAFVTMSTTGYGDIIPFTIIGKVIAVILMVMGPILTAVVGAITILVFLNTTDNINIDRKECPECGESNSKKSKYCRDCGKKFKNKKA